ncbi:tRNA (5-methylaminomethyl-2-thiouridine)(34)-methyltransferase MnmD [Flavobacteriaceae bacterium]|nr:tRNA (5-methylaminomethyl-2-thiouridine)(34)-methyltransferase MnmD [Flavobacteriaceae bacterium]MDA9015314.1 tRNA (5-methylaminomethyl-2-thiouridine)(34)-methyltransferase MnmD [Flavobacteriaceae bacterium]MDC3354072.1 tRNA (5-methylaminomethyl-2-thiouridine)(34)-methyltransferase MnmD [Flavobacteriaceae bacterium]
MNFRKSWVPTKDGSYTIKINSLKETYHSLHGAVTESEFVYVKNGLRFWQNTHPEAKAAVLEMGYGTGLLAYLNFLDQFDSKMNIDYTALEAYPLTITDLERLNYDRFIASEECISFLQFSKLEWEKVHQLTTDYSLLKREILFEKFESKTLFDVIYYDAFGAHAQPDLWNTEWMKKCFDLLNHGGVWVSFCAKGSVRRALQEVGFVAERLPGPPGKREMLRAVKP